MDDGSFDQNFTWFEWGFVDPSDVESDDGRGQRETNGYTAAYPGHGTGLQKWDEDHRWPT